MSESGEIDLDAIIIDGSSLNFGAVAGVTEIIHTISLARKVMEKTNHGIPFYSYLSLHVKYTID